MNNPKKLCESLGMEPLSPEEHEELRATLLQAHEMDSIDSASNKQMRSTLLERKLTLCLVPIDWHKQNDAIETLLIENKRKILLEILEIFGKRNKKLFKTRNLLVTSFRFLWLNLFRALPDPDSMRTKDSDAEMDFREPCWDHLVLIYEIAFHVVTNTEVDKKTMQLFVGGRFLRQLVGCFKSLDDREPQYVKIILHAIYGRFMLLRKEIREILCYFCYEYVYESKTELVDSNQSLLWQGIPEVLAILCSIIQGLNTPVKQDYHSLLRNVLIPLHKTFHVDAFHEELLQCSVQFLLKDRDSLDVLLGGILKFWPRTSPLKQQLYIDEIVQLVKSAGEIHKNTKMISRVVKQLCDCMLSSHHQIAERSLLIWKEDHMMKLLALDEKNWAMVMQTMKQMTKNYWLPEIRTITKSILQELTVTNPRVFKKRIKKKNKLLFGQDVFKQKERQGRWEKLRQLAIHK